MLVLRSLAFNVYLYSLTAGMAVVCAPLLILPGRFSLMAIKSWAGLALWGLRTIAGIRYEIRGAEFVPQGGALIAAKHQSMWETIAVFRILKTPAVVLKKELSFIPLYGWFAIRAGMVVVDRAAHARALKAMTARARARLDDGAQIVIFPEGSRAPPGQSIGYKPGIAALYTQLGVPCVPVALNSGLYWGRRTFLRRPGTIVVQFLPPIDAGLKRKAFMSELEARIETASNALLDMS